MPPPASEGGVGDADREKGLLESVEGEGGCGVDGDDGKDPMTEDADETATTADGPAPAAAGCWEDAEGPLGESPGEAVGVGKPLSGVDPRLKDVRGNLMSGSNSCPTHPQLSSEG